MIIEKNLESEINTFQVEKQEVKVPARMSIRFRIY